MAYVCMYLREFEATAECNHWNSEEKATALILVFREKALILSNIPMGKQKDQAVVVAALVTMMCVTFTSTRVKIRALHINE